MPCKLINYLHNSSKLSNVFDALERLEKQNFVFKNILGPELAMRCKLAKIENGRALVIIDSSAWASKFRYAIPDLLKNLRVQPEFQNLKEIRYQITAQPFSKKAKNNAPNAKLSEKNAELLRRTAKKIQNVKLKEGLEKLARNCTI
ncbi:MAG: DUF721 domain-containing protein [Gammaproteobacteria bacterium]